MHDESSMLAGTHYLDAFISNLLIAGGKDHRGVSLTHSARRPLARVVSNYRKCRTIFVTSRADVFSVSDSAFQTDFLEHLHIGAHVYTLYTYRVYCPLFV